MLVDIHTRYGRDTGRWKTFFSWAERSVSDSLRSRMKNAGIKTGYGHYTAPLSKRKMNLLFGIEEGYLKRKGYPENIAWDSRDFQEYIEESPVEILLQSGFMRFSRGLEHFHSVELPLYHPGEFSDVLELMIASEEELSSPIQFHQVSFRDIVDLVIILKRKGKYFIMNGDRDQLWSMAGRINEAMEWGALNKRRPELYTELMQSGNMVNVPRSSLGNCYVFPNQITQLATPKPFFIAEPSECLMVGIRPNPETCTSLTLSQLLCRFVEPPVPRFCMDPDCYDDNDRASIPKRSPYFFLRNCRIPVGRISQLRYAVKMKIQLYALDRLFCSAFNRMAEDKEALLFEDVYGFPYESVLQKLKTMELFFSTAIDSHIGKDF